MFQPRLNRNEQAKRNARRDHLTVLYDNALLRELVYAADFNLCVSPQCTTCGSLEFIENVFRCVTGSKQEFKSSHEFIDQAKDLDVQMQIANALATVEPPDEVSSSIEPPAILLILAAHDVIKNAAFNAAFLGDGRNIEHRSLKGILGDSWAGDVLSLMQGRYERRLARLELRQQQEAAARKQRAEDREQRQRTRQQRKEVRDREFHARGVPPSKR
jgi:hypothetical protein